MVVVPHEIAEDPSPRLVVRLRTRLHAIVFGARALWVFEVVRGWVVSAESGVCLLSCTVRIQTLEMVNRNHLLAVILWIRINVWVGVSSSGELES